MKSGYKMQKKKSVKNVRYIIAKVIVMMIADLVKKRWFKRQKIIVVDMRHGKILKQNVRMCIMTMKFGMRLMRSR